MQSANLMASTASRPWRFWHRRDPTAAEIKASEITRHYQVTFSRNSEVAYKVYTRDATGTRTRHKLVCRAPTLEELLGIEAALKRADPSYRAFAKSSSVKFYFLVSTDPDHGTAVAWFFPRDKNGNPAVYFSPGFSAARLPTEAHAETAGEQRRNTVEAVTIHELAHNGQHNNGWHDVERRSQIAAQLGWVEGADDQGNVCWYLRSRGGELFRRGVSGVWLRCDSRGHYLDSHGAVTDLLHAFRRSPSALRKIAAVRPVSLYFTTPAEMGAEGMLAFRLDRHHRGMLLRDCSRLYDFIKGEDEREIRWFYGADRLGQPNVIRMPDGTLAANTAENRRRVADFEDSIRDAWRL